jgi:hypothetical protein
MWKTLFTSPKEFVTTPLKMFSEHLDEIEVKIMAANKIDKSKIMLPETLQVIKEHRNLYLAGEITFEVAAIVAPIPKFGASNKIRTLVAKVTERLGLAKKAEEVTRFPHPYIRPSKEVTRELEKAVEREVGKLEGRSVVAIEERGKEGRLVKSVSEGREEFYPRVQQPISSKGYRVHSEVKGKGPQHMRKPDFVAEKNNEVIIGETKSPKEPPTSSSWRTIQQKDSEEFRKVREDVVRREKIGEVSPEVGGHEIIIRGQIKDYAQNMGKTWDCPVNTAGKKIRGAYAAPTEQASNVEQALRNCGKTFEKIDEGNGVVVYIFDL